MRQDMKIETSGAIKSMTVSDGHAMQLLKASID